ncbi:hypothetical protein SO802_021153 [Lithocarpus litseifolius]|uniref:Uncharacterized protein n=1 Tax=Lithocarpus litseifolius TaxID=425828 RepID=A0AAW2CGH7_9ROSI
MKRALSGKRESLLSIATTWSMEDEAGFNVQQTRDKKVGTSLSSTNKFDGQVTLWEGVRPHIPCGKDREGKVVYEKPEKPHIHIDGTGFISEDLALICGNNVHRGERGNNVHRGERTRDENIETNPSIVELESNLLAMQRQESKSSRTSNWLYHDACWKLPDEVP